jgi:hypothetical protein
MSTSVYTINKNINKPIEFKGLKAQYIWWLGIGLVMLLLVFAILYFIGVNNFIALGVIVLMGMLLFGYVYRISRKYGEHGLMKAIARKRVPHTIKLYSRSVFTGLKGKFVKDNFFSPN